MSKPDRNADEDHGGRASGPTRVRVLVVDDSALMRRLLCDLLRSSPEIEVAGTARDGREAVLQAVRLKPDVITLDVEMPEVTGLEALPLLLAAHEAPVIMVSALTQEGADVTLQALELGAVDFMPKPERNQLAEMRASSDLLVAKVLTAAQSRVRRIRRTTSPSTSTGSSPTTRSGKVAITRSSPPRPRPATAERPDKPAEPSTTNPSTSPFSRICLVIGISTGGPQALSHILPLLTAPMPPILVVQHMIAQFTGVFANRLDHSCSLTIKEAAEGDLVLPNQVLIAPGGRHMMVAGNLPRARIGLCDDAPVSGHKPSVDVLFQSAAKVYQAGVVGIIMTGMGRDGVNGCKTILAAGGFTLGQDEATSVVYGMNKAAFVAGALKAQFALDDLPGILKNLIPFRDEVEGRKPEP
ncbi:MAG TPA: chemotaxis response regulator protein-glutamate methylesterase [Isosphaeraceae bacterium]|nr:chemotaxis response regulator protein-glutamate methylesterase [Isosphaeraceae bacterium]